MKQKASYITNNQNTVIKKTSLVSQNYELFHELQDIKNLSDTFFNLSINIQLIARSDGTIIKISNNSEKLLGYTQDELENTSFLDLIHPDDKDATIKEMEKLHSGEPVYYFENRYHHKDGHYIVLGWSADSNEDNTLIYASAHDKSTLKKNEQLVLQQSKLASMGEMLENIAHQWKQPLSIISTYASSLDLKNDLNLLKTEDIKSTTENIISNAKHLSSTIDTFRNFYKSDKIKKTFKIKDTLNTTFKLASSQFRKANIIIEEEIDDITFNGLENELIQIFMNVLNNARDELIKKDTARVLLINAYVIDNHIKIDITDNAGGIPDEILPRVFDSHFSTKTDTAGTGIGLYMSKTIVEEHLNGKITAKNIEFSHNDIAYKGARFSILLPLCAK